MPLHDMEKGAADPRFRGLTVLVLALLALLATACAGKGPDHLPPHLLSLDERVIPGVPFHPQTTGQCGPASLASVLNLHGDPATPQEIAAHVLRPDLRGSLTLDLALWPRSRGFTTRWYAGSVQDIAVRVLQGQPLVVMLDQGLGPVSSNHFVVVTGHAPEAVLVHDSDKGPWQRMAWPRFLRQWERAGRWTLLVEPAHEAGPNSRARGEEPK